MLTKDFLIEAAELVVGAGYAQFSLIQRRMRVGFATANHLMLGLEDIGVISPSDGTSRARDILVPAFDRAAVADAIDRAESAGRFTIPLTNTAPSSSGSES